MFHERRSLTHMLYVRLGRKSFGKATAQNKGPKRTRREYHCSLSDSFSAGVARRTKVAQLVRAVHLVPFLLRPDDTADEHGSDLHERDGDGRTVRSVAREQRHWVGSDVEMRATVGGTTTTGSQQGGGKSQVLRHDARSAAKDGEPTHRRVCSW